MEGKKPNHGFGGAAPTGGRGLNLQQKLFCEIYVHQAPFFNSGKAYREAGYSDSSRQGSTLLRRPAIAAYIEELRYAACLRNNITLDDIINQYARIAFFDPRSIYDETGKLLKMIDFDDVAATAIASYDQEEIGAGEYNIGTLKKVKPYDRIVALDRLRECLGFKEKMVKTKRDAEGKLLETEETEFSGDTKIIYEDHSGKLNDEDIQV